MHVPVFVCVCVFQKATEGKGVDVIVEMLANANLSKDLKMLAPKGRVAVSCTKMREINSQRSIASKRASHKTAKGHLLRN